MSVPIDIQESSDWRDEFFGEDYLFLYEPKLTSKRTDFEINFLIKNALSVNSKSILDVPCGFGRHSEIFAEKGYVVHGIDSSETMIKAAEERRGNLSTAAQKRLTYEQADMRSFDANERFDVALSLFSSLGYFENGKENESYIANLCSSVHTQGVVVIDIRNPIRDLIDFSKTDWKQNETQDEIQITQNFNPISLYHTITYHYQHNGMVREKTAKWRHYFLPELSDILVRYGCTIEKTFGNFKGERYNPESHRLIVVARRR